MCEKRSEADRIFGELVKKAIDESDEELDFFKRMSKVEIPPPETFMIGRPGRPWWRRWLGWVWAKKK